MDGAYRQDKQSTGGSPETVSAAGLGLGWQGKARQGKARMRGPSTLSFKDLNDEHYISNNNTKPQLR